MKKYIGWLALTLFVLMGAACNFDQSGGYNAVADEDRELINSMAKNFNGIPNVKRAGYGGFLIYLDRSTGRSLNPREWGGRGIGDKVRLMIRLGKIPDSFTKYQTNAKFIDKVNGYERWGAINGSISPRGLIIFNSDDGRKVYVEIWRSGNCMARMPFRDGFFVEYLYRCSHLNENREVYREVDAWLSLINQQVIR